MPFDIEGAKKAGYSDAEIADHLGTEQKFDVASARKAGYSDMEILGHLTSATSAPVSDNTPLWATGQGALGQLGPTAYGLAGAAKETLAPITEGLGLAVGGIVGTPLGPVGQVTGAGLGYAGAKRLGTITDQYLGNTPPETLGGALKQTGKDVISGAQMEAGGQVAGVVLSKGAELAGKGIKQVLGATTGTGPGTIDEALKGSQAFKDAMRGKTSGEDIVSNVQDALKSLKDQRAATYQTELEKLSQNTDSINLQPVQNKLNELLKNYNIKSTGVSGEYDFSRSTLNKSAAKDVEEVINMVKSWGTTKGDRTPVMVDTLKRRIDDFYSESSQARQFVYSLKDTVRKTLLDNVPQYAKMTKGYSEASSLIKDVQKGLMVGKEQTADQTLRRLSSSMRENFEMRRDLVNILGDKAQEDLAGQIAGYNASQLIPRGLVGKLTAGSAAYVSAINPKFWPILAASSPRVVGEFLSIYGKALTEIKGVSGAIGRIAAYAGTKAMDTAIPQDVMNYARDNGTK